MNFPSPWATFTALVALVRSGALLTASATSLQSLALGFAAAVILGVLAVVALSGLTSSIRRNRGAV